MFHVHVYNGWSPGAKWLLGCSGSTRAFQQDKKALIFDIEWFSEGCGVQQWGVSVPRTRRLLLFYPCVAAFSFNNIFNEIHSSSILSLWPSFMLGRLQWPHWLQWHRSTNTNKMQLVGLLFWYVWIIQAYSIHVHWGPTGGRKERNSSLKLINKVVHLVFPCLRLQRSLPRWMFIRISYLTWKDTPIPWPLYHIFHLYGRKERSTLA